MPTATPLRKSRRVMRRFIPDCPSQFLSLRHQGQNSSAFMLTGNLLFRRRWLRLRGTISPRVRGSKVCSCSGVVKHCLASSHHCGIILPQHQIVSLLTQRARYLRGDSRLEKNGALDRLTCVADCEAWSGKRCLDIPSIICDVRHKLRVRKRLIGTSHNSESDVFVAPFHECRNNCVERALVRSQSIRMLGIEHKQSTSILQQKAHAFYGDARAEIVVHTLDQGSDI